MVQIFCKAAKCLSFYYDCYFLSCLALSCPHCPQVFAQVEMSYLSAKSVHDGDVVWLGFIRVGEQDVVGHEFSRVQTELEPLVSDLLSISQVLLGPSQMGESCELPVK